MARDVYINPVTNDIEQDETGQLKLVSGVALVAQRVRIRLKAHRGEWPLDITKGVPWRDEIFVKAPNLGQVSATIRKVILDTPGIERLLSFDLSLDRAARQLVVTFSALAEGETLEFTEVF